MELLYLRQRRLLKLTPLWISTILNTILILLSIKFLKSRNVNSKNKSFWINERQTRKQRNPQMMKYCMINNKIKSSLKTINLQARNENEKILKILMCLMTQLRILKISSDKWDEWKRMKMTKSQPNHQL